MSEKLDYLAPAIRSLAVPIDSISADPANARTHSDRNIQVIAGSLRAFRQQTPIVVDAQGVIRKGSGTWAAAKSLGWTHIAAVVSDLQGSALTGYAIADNRAGEQEVGSMWDREALARQLECLQSEDAALALATGHTADEIAAFIAQANGTTAFPAGADGKEYDESAADDVELIECPECHHRFPA